MPQLVKIMDENQNQIELVESDSDPDIDLDAELEDTLDVADLARLDGVIPRVEVHSPPQQQVISTAASTGLRQQKLDFLFICVICVMIFLGHLFTSLYPFYFRLW